MSKTTSKIAQICTQEEFERFKSFHELFKQYIKEGDLPSEQCEKLFEDINDFETSIVPIAKKVGIDLSKHIDTVGEMWEQPELTHPEVTCAGWSGDRVEEAIESVYCEYEAKVQDRKSAIADLDKLMVALYTGQPKNTEVIESMTAVFENALERVKADLAEKDQKPRSILKRTIGWIFKKTSHLICVIIVAVIATTIATIIVDIFADFGWTERIKAFIQRIFSPD